MKIILDILGMVVIQVATALTAMFIKAWRKNHEEEETQQRKEQQNVQTECRQDTQSKHSEGNHAARRKMPITGEDRDKNNN